jgi:hypothetical protein
LGEHHNFNTNKFMPTNRIAGISSANTTVYAPSALVYQIRMEALRGKSEIAARKAA